MIIEPWLEHVVKAIEHAAKTPYAAARAAHKAFTELLLLRTEGAIEMCEHCGCKWDDPGECLALARCSDQQCPIRRGAP